MRFLITALAFAAGALIARRPQTTVVNVAPAQPVPEQPVQEKKAEPPVMLSQLSFEFIAPPRYDPNAEIPTDDVDQTIKIVAGMSEYANNDSIFAGTLPENYPELLEAKIDQAILREIIAERKIKQAA
jgi:hypothetical protein